MQIAKLGGEIYKIDKQSLTRPKPLRVLQLWKSRFRFQLFPCVVHPGNVVHLEKAGSKRPICQWPLYPGTLAVGNAFVAIPVILGIPRENVGKTQGPLPAPQSEEGNLSTDRRPALLCPPRDPGGVGPDVRGGGD